MAWASYLGTGQIIARYEPWPDKTIEEMNELYPDTTFIQCEGNIASDTHYVSEGVIAERTALSASWDSTTVVADGASEIVLSGLPVPCSVYIDGNAVLVEDGSLEFSADAPGDYNVRVDEVAHLEQEWTVSAV